MIRRFNRFELKYVVHVFAAERFLRDIAPALRRDPHAGPEGFYPVLSLYYDSPDLHLFRSKVEGIKFRRKLRLRIYPRGDLSGVTHGMVEIKQRIDRTLQKRRLHLPLDEAERVCAGEGVPRGLDAQDRATASEVTYMVAGMGLRPTCVIAYQRRAFLGGRYDPGLRVTVDTNLKARSHALQVTLPAVNHRVLPPHFSIVEVKFNDGIPRWLASRLRAHPFDLSRVSKYCAGVAMTHPYRLREKALAAGSIPIAAGI
jgi:hypothetical protein